MNLFYPYRLHRAFGKNYHASFMCLGKTEKTTKYSRQTQGKCISVSLYEILPFQLFIPRKAEIAWRFGPKRTLSLKSPMQKDKSVLLLCVFGVRPGFPKLDIMYAIRRSFE